MNNRPVDQALATLLPTYANDIPQELRSLALSFVAQSRSFSASLKPDEEIARPFACAEIACKRLARALKLPPLLGRPPCPPRTYKKLYTFLERTLTPSLSSPKRAGNTSAPGTPSRSGSAPTTPTKASRVIRTPSKAPATPRGLENTPSKSTPLKRTFTNADETRTPQRLKKVHTDSHLTSSKISDAPSWVMSSIRMVCKTLSTPAPRMSTWSRPPISRTLSPHIYAGVSSILYFIDAENDLDEEAMEFLEPVTSAKDREKDEDFKETANALVVAVYFLVLARRRQPSESSPDPPQDDSRKMDKKTFSEMRQTALVSLGLRSTECRHREDVDQWIALIMEQDWAHGKEWFENIPQAGELDGDNEYLSDENGHYGEEGTGRISKRQKTLPGDRGSFSATDSSRCGLLPGLGTMMQNRVDWLSAERREDYVEWKADIVRRVEQIGAAA
ncbi:origin recognition complex, subunit 6 [Aspergillus cavernicola]|uniref:Origin recognition complex, subunit 6 n=1 Tax=Aspergillus cavernicola TaxID=176166 RepID=A0ABR4IUN1_9EURO